MAKTFYTVICIVAAVILVIIVATLILLERKLLALSQRRIGPVILGKRGILQIVADVVKPLFKDIFEQKIQTASTIAFSIVMLFSTQLSFSELFSFGISGIIFDNFDGMLFFQMFLTGLTCIAVLLIGYLSGSKYGMLGAVRLAVSELSIDTASFLVNSLIFGSTSGFEFESVILNQSDFSILGVTSVILSTINTIQMFISAQRSPIDLIEVEGELVAGYNTEYSGADVLVIYFSEYFHLFNAGVQFILQVVCGLYISMDLIDLFSTEILSSDIADWYSVCADLACCSERFKFAAI